MSGNNKYMKDNHSKEILLLLIDNAKALAANAEKIQLQIERIKQSCRKSGTVGEAHKNLLLARANDMKNLVDLHNSAAKHLLNAASKLENGVPLDEIVAEMRIYSTFLVDQLKSEDKEICRVFSILLNDLLKFLSG